MSTEFAFRFSGILLSAMRTAQMMVREASSNKSHFDGFVTGYYTAVQSLKKVIDPLITKIDDVDVEQIYRVIKTRSTFADLIVGRSKYQPPFVQGEADGNYAAIGSIERKTYILIAEIEGMDIFMFSAREEFYRFVRSQYFDEDTLSIEFEWLDRLTKDKKGYKQYVWDREQINTLRIGNVFTTDNHVIERRYRFTFAYSKEFRFVQYKVAEERLPE